MDILRILGYAFVVFVVVSTIISDYPPKDVWGWSTVVLFCAGAAIVAILSVNRAAFWVSIRNRIVVGAWISIALLLYLMTVETIFSGLGATLYIAFIVVAAALIGLLNEDIPKYRLVDHEVSSSLAFARGIIYGLYAYAIATIILALGIGLGSMSSIAPQILVGPITVQLHELFGIGIEFLLMVFIVAVPEELMARVFYFKMGSTVLDPVTAALLTLVTGYGMHAVTRYGIEYGSLVLFVITLVWLILTICYVRHGLLGSIAAHATYNTMITAMYYGSGYAIIAAVIAVVAAYGYMYIKRVVVTF